MFSFEKLDVWQESRKLAVDVCKLVDAFPQKERFSLAEQLRRSAVSVPSNIAEGSGRGHKAEFVRFIGIAYGSLMEVVTQLTIATDLGYVSNDGLQTLKVKAERIAVMLSGLKRSLGREQLRKHTLRSNYVEKEDVE
jgi:four helix bundle protein